MNASAAALADRFSEGLAGAAGNEALVRKGRTLTAQCVVHIADTPFLLKIAAGVLTECTRQLPLLCTRDFTIRGSAAAWEALWEYMPRAGWHDLLALTKRGEMTIEGDMQKVMAHLQFIKDLLGLPRSAA
ncbi:MAG TPA: hypothetical protein VIG66_10990 [Noviherbaspirillum sp.]